jgi:energy-converting hydrogenase Eha subunit C
LVAVGALGQQLAVLEVRAAVAAHTIIRQLLEEQERLDKEVMVVVVAIEMVMALQEAQEEAAVAAAEVQLEALVETMLVSVGRVDKDWQIIIEQDQM